MTKIRIEYSKEKGSVIKAFSEIKNGATVTVHTEDIPIESVPFLSELVVKLDEFLENIGPQMEQRALISQMELIRVSNDPRTKKLNFTGKLNLDGAVSKKK